jgi:GLPGLI family protein
MKNFLLFVICVLVWSVSISAQTSLSIKYRCTYNLSGNIEKQAELLVVGSKAMFKHLTPSTTPPVESREGNDNGTKTVSLNLTLTDSIGVRYFTDLQKNEIIAREILFQEGKNQVFIVKEHIEPIIWEVKEEQKKVGRFNCQKAIGKFRGRTYTAWFTPEIPIHFGPWKLHGLPGLIVEVADDQKALLMQVQSIMPAVVSTNSIFQPADGKEKSFKEFFSMVQNIGSDFEKFVQAKLPRGAKFEVTSVSKNTLELSEMTNE